MTAIFKTGSAAPDYSGNGNEGTLSNGIALSEGKFGKGGEFDGTDDEIVVSDNDTISPTQFTLNFWMKADNAADTGAYELPVLKSGGNGYYNYGFNWRNSNGAHNWKWSSIFLSSNLDHNEYRYLV
jgi:hypothetical protein